MSPVSNQLLEPVASSRLVGVPPRRREIPPRVVSSGRRWDLVPYQYVDRSDAGPPSATTDKGPWVPIWNNSSVHRLPSVAPVVTIDSSATVVGEWGAHTTQPVATFRVRHDAGSLSLLGACIQDSSRARYRQGWAEWNECILLYFGESDFHTLCPEVAGLRSVGMAFVHYL